MRCVLFGGASPLDRTAEMILPAGWYTSGAMLHGPGAAAAGDVDGDGRPDVAAFIGNDDSDVVWSTTTQLRLQLIHGGPSPALGAFVELGTFDGNLWQVAALDDLDGDGFGDLLAATSSLQLWFGSADGLRATPQTLTLPAGASPYVEAIAGGVDYDGDGRPDVAIIVDSYPHEQAVLFHGAGGGVRDATAPTVFTAKP